MDVLVRQDAELRERRRVVEEEFLRQPVVARLRVLEPVGIDGVGERHQPDVAPVVARAPQYLRLGDDPRQLLDARDRDGESGGAVGGETETNRRLTADDRDGAKVFAGEKR